tara:strand:+ start:424 stop:717 length:294 start_codon:yes stop_codon:yes gene_type:complete
MEIQQSNWTEYPNSDGSADYGINVNFGILLSELMEHLPEYSDEQLLKVFDSEALAELLQELVANQSGDELRDLQCIQDLEAEIDEAKDIDNQYNQNN